jgi:uncharacterized damage-inducible protein DinB
MMKDQLLKTWEIHHSKNQLLLQSLSDEMLDKSLSTRGGRNIRRQFSHIHQTRLQWLEICDKNIYKSQTVIDKNELPLKSRLAECLDQSSQALASLFTKAMDEGGKVKGFKTGVIPMMGYFISHESHHRGNILLTLKQCGEKIPDAVKWQLWEWAQ